MYRVILVIGLLAVAACADDIQKKDILPTAPRKVATAASSLAALKIDTTKASSVCKAAVRQNLRARVRVAQTPSDRFGERKVKMLDALMSDACR
jgi:outer membrane murein-binding lipoprotein Lpp